ncbi:hypothetical protein TWF970_001166 [Orbilia oligospora]|uniref:GH16 domain-containing protein n=1 Tax=Orbilia oligospora TaxID=2813651 RepID=A0A7C8RE22_ORBOL|nr:hypothetical protein TWF970_001166 [Orbilia oligospora]
MASSSFSSSNVGESSSSSSSASGSGRPYLQPGTRFSTSSIISDYASSHIQRQKRPFVTYKLKEKYEQPWLVDPRLKSRKRTNNVIIYTLSCIGLAAAAVYCWTGTRQFPKREYCIVLDDDFTSGIDPSVWNYEIQLDGYGNGHFDWTTSDPTNAYTDKNGLHIVPTLTNETTTITNDQILNGYTLNLTTTKTCTSQQISACGIRSNSTTGKMINPVRSARLTTKGKRGIAFGKMEIVAKLPRGDWLWPAIWMMPAYSVYGTWPASGEIDIVESRGNNYDFPQGGRDHFGSALHWGPYPGVDAYWRTMGQTTLKRSDFSKEFYTFGLEWTEDYIVTYVNNRIHQVMYIPFTKGGFWQRGEFIKYNATEESNPWRPVEEGGKTHHIKAAPFDQEFYLLLNVAVGGTNGYFKDSTLKPWVDGSGREMRDFWNAVNQWHPTWGSADERGMTVKSVKMWQEGKC